MSNVTFQDQQATPVQAVEQQAGTQDQQVDYSAKFKELDARFSTVQKRVDDSQEYIKQLKAQLEEKEIQLAKSRKLDDVYSALQTDPNKQHQQLSEPQVHIDAEEIATKVEEKIAAKLKAEQIASVEAQNLNTVRAEVSKLYGQNVDAEISKIAAENDMTIEDAFDLAKAKPKAFLSIFAKQPVQPANTSFSKSSINTLSVQQKAGNKEPDFKTDKSAWLRWKHQQYANQ